MFQIVLFSFRLLLRAGASGVEPKIISNPCYSSMCKIVCSIKGAQATAASNCANDMYLLGCIILLLHDLS